MFQTFVGHAFPTIIVRYKELLAAPERHARSLSEFAELPGSKGAIKQAAAFIESLN